MVALRIRSAEPADVAALRDVYRRSSLSVEADRPHLLAHPEVLAWDPAPVAEGRVRVAVVGGRIIGFSTTSVVAGAADVLELDDLFVDPDVHRLGTGRALVADIVSQAEARSLRTVAVTAGQQALPFYRAVGFLHAGTTPTRFGPAPRLHLPLPPAAP